MRSPPPHVAVVGAGEAGPEDLAVAEDVGRELARRGAVVVCGGLGGVMEAVCRGARQAGGRTIGILPGDDRSHANPHVEVAIATGLGEARNLLVVRTADVVVAVGGEFGTLSEIAFALRLGTPVIGIGTWELSRRGRPVDAIHRVGTAAEAADQAILRSTTSE
ncbi:MAG TPA: TIGR00725 family protein [Acidimicrobiales bacterium]